MGGSYLFFCFFVFFVPNVFSTCSQHVPLRVPKFLSCSLRHSQWHLNFIPYDLPKVQLFHVKLKRSPIGDTFVKAKRSQVPNRFPSSSVKSNSKSLLQVPSPYFVCIQLQSSILSKYLQTVAIANSTETIIIMMIATNKVSSQGSMQ